jgi:hypothetical protein
MKTQTVYKVVHQNFYMKYVSAITSHNFLTYEFNKETFPVFGKIFVFDTIENAREFSGKLIFEGIGTNPTRMKEVAYFTYDAEEFWKMKRNKKAPTVQTKAPPIGTLFVDSFIPLRVVKE